MQRVKDHKVNSQVAGQPRVKTGKQIQHGEEQKSKMKSWKPGVKQEPRGHEANRHRANTLTLIDKEVQVNQVTLIRAGQPIRVGGGVVVGTGSVKQDKIIEERATK